MAASELNVKLTADDQLSPVLRGIRAELDELDNEYGELLQTKFEWRPWAISIAGWVAALLVALN